MSDTGGPDTGKTSNKVALVNYAKANAAMITGAAATYSNYWAMRQIVRGNLVRGPAYVFAFAFGLVNYKIYKNLFGQVKDNGKVLIKNQTQNRF